MTIAKIEDGVDAHHIKTTLHVELNDELVVQKQYDAEPHLRYAEQARQSTAGMNWGGGRFVGHIPAAEYGRFLLIRDNQERKKAILKWLRENNKFVMFDRFLRT